MSETTYKRRYKTIKAENQTAQDKTRTRTSAQATSPASDDQTTPPPAQPVFAGSLHPAGRQARELPPQGYYKTYILTCAQNNTRLHAALWTNLLALVEHDQAEILVSSFTYATNSEASIGQKRTVRKKTAREPLVPVEVWDARVVPYQQDSSIQIAPGLVWCGELQILPTAVNPISGLESYTGRDSCIIPHVKFAMQSVPTPKFSDTKFIYTTGTVTLRNYIQKKTGQKASFHHGYGALIVQVCDDGTWFVRQLWADIDGDFYDLDRKVSKGRITYNHRPEALVWGDIHTRCLESHIRNLAWGQDGILDTLKPKRQFLHDVLHFLSQNHHDIKDPWKVYGKYVTATTDVADEFDECARFIEEAHRPWCETVVVASNHDEATLRWLKDVDYRTDPQNAEFILQVTAETYKALRRQDTGFYPVEWALRLRMRQTSRVKFLRRDESYVVCDDESGGIELGMHGDKGANGTRGNLRDFSRSGRKCIVADSHTAGIRDGAMQVGVMGSLDQIYNIGQSSWSHTNALVYRNGKRTLFTISNAKWRAA